MKLKENMQMPDFVYLSPYEQDEKHASEYIKGKKAVIVFLRYYGCTSCRLDLHIYAQRIEEFKAKGAQLMVVLQSSPETVAEEAEKGFFPFEIACDPSQTVYRQFEIEPAKSKLKLVGGGLFKLLKKMKQAKKFGFEHGAYEGNEEQLPAVVIVDENGVIKYSHYAKNIVDKPTVDEMVNML